MADVPENTGGFSMGYTGIAANTIPVHTVESISPFSMGAYEVTPMISV